MRIRILVCEDHGLVREGICSLLERESDLEVIAEASDGQSAVKLSQEHHPDIVLMDIGLPDMNGIEATRLIIEAHPETRVIAVSAHAEQQTVQDMFQAGALSYITKRHSSNELLQGIRDAATGKMYVTPDVAGVVVRKYVSQVSGESADGSDLTGREREILKLLTDGLSAKVAGHRLGISVKTVESHRRNLMAKTGYFNIAELTKYAIREGITFLEK